MAAVNFPFVGDKKWTDGESGKETVHKHIYSLCMKYYL
jgi:hypothetical protein